MNTMRILKGLTIAVATSMAFGAYADVGGLPQASLNLEGSSMHYCNTQQNQWSVTKEANTSSVVSGGSVTWTITATKNPDGPAASEFCVEGTLVITNSGAASANVGNIVVNLQRQRLVSGKQRWVSASANIATKVDRNLATTANVVAAATAEDAGWNLAVYGAGNQTYTSSGGVGTFKENAASGALVFADADWNSVLANNAYVIAPGATVTLNYTATFNGTALGINAPNGPTSLRTEVLVTFGNAGGRGGSGASLDNVDIGTGQPEAHVRTVPVRTSMNVPPLEQCNDSVTLTDVMTGSGVTGEVTGGTMPESLVAETNATATYTIETTLTGVGSMTNTVTLAGTETDCCVAASGEASAIVQVTEEPPCTTCNQCPCGESETIPGRCNPCSGSYCTFSQGGYQGGGTPGQIMNANFTTVFNTGLMIGNYTPTTVPAAPFGSFWTATAVGKDALQSFLAGGGPSGKLTADLLNPESSAGGSLGKQTAALTLNIGFGAAGLLLPGSTGFGSVMVCPVVADFTGPCPVPTMTVSAFLNMANLALSGATSGWNYSELAGVAEKLNLSFHYVDGVCNASSWAATHLGVAQQ